MQLFTFGELNPRQKTPTQLSCNTCLYTPAKRFINQAERLKARRENCQNTCCRTKNTTDTFNGDISKWLSQHSSWKSEYRNKYRNRIKKTNFLIHFLKEANPCSSMVLNILEFQVNHLLPAVLSRLRGQMVTVREKLINLISNFQRNFPHSSTTQIMFLVDRATSMPQPSFVILATLLKMKTKKLKH